MHVKRNFETKLALGGDATIVLVANSELDLSKIFKILWVKIFSFERKFSRFLTNNELINFNRKAGIEQDISQDFKELLLSSEEMSIFSEGLYNPFILPDLQRQGYLNSALSGYEEDEVVDFRNRSVVSPDKLQVKRGKALIPYNTALDLGGIGKGFLLDKLAKVLDGYELIGFWISLSGDIITYGKDINGRPWRINVQSAKDPSKNLEEVIISDSNRLAVATSGTLRRSGHIFGNQWHHIINPATGKPAETDIILTTVATNDALEADVLATCAVILGSKRAPAFLKKKGVSAFIIQTQNSFFMYGDIITGKTKEALAYALH